MKWIIIISSQGKFHFQIIISQGFSQTEDITRVLKMNNKITMSKNDK